MTMLTMHCAEKNEVVAVHRLAADLLVNVYEQEDGMLINVQSQEHNVEALLTAKQPALDLYTKLMSGEIVAVDDIFIGNAPQQPEGYDPEDGDDEDF